MAFLRTPRGSAGSTSGEESLLYVQIIGNSKKKKNTKLLHITFEATEFVIWNSKSKSAEMRHQYSNVSEVRLVAALHEVQLEITKPVSYVCLSTNGTDPCKRLYVRIKHEVDTVQRFRRVSRSGIQPVTDSMLIKQCQKAMLRALRAEPPDSVITPAVFEATGDPDFGIPVVAGGLLYMVTQDVQEDGIVINTTTHASEKSCVGSLRKCIGDLMRLAAQLRKFDDHRLLMDSLFVDDLDFVTQDEREEVMIFRAELMALATKFALPDKQEHALLMQELQTQFERRFDRGLQRNDAKNTSWSDMALLGENSSTDDMFNKSGARVSVPPSGLAPCSDTSPFESSGYSD